MAQLTPEAEETLLASFENNMTDVYTSIPGIVVTVVDLKAQIINVQPSINLRSPDGLDAMPRPIIANVPFHMPLTKQGGLSYPISVGTPVMLNFSMRSLEIWKRSNGYPTTPSDLSRFSIKDCWASPGYYPFSESPNDPSKRSNAHDPNDVVLVHNIGSGNEVEIRLKANGDVEVNSPTKVIINCEDAEVNSSTSTTISTGDMTIDSDSFIVTTGSFALTATDGATMSATIDMTGSFKLNGTTVEDHDHGGVQPGGARTEEFGA